MRPRTRLSLGGKLFLVHFSLVAVFWVLLFLFPQPRASITDGEHWFWDFLEFCHKALLRLTLPVSRYMSHGVAAPFILWTNAKMFIPLCFILALNSLFIGYSLELVLRLARLVLKKTLDAHAQA
jgi:hypothetical protein